MCRRANRPSSWTAWQLSSRGSSSSSPGAAVLRAPSAATTRPLSVRQVVSEKGPDGKPLVDVVVRVYDVATGQAVRSFSGGDDPLLALAFSPDGAHLAAAGYGRRTVLLWDLAAERPTLTHEGPEL